MKHFNSMIFLFIFVTNITATVSASVINKQQLKIHISLI